MHGPLEANGPPVPGARGSRLPRVPMHGAWGGAPHGPRNGRYRLGLFTAEVVEATRLVRSLVRDAGRQGE